MTNRKLQTTMRGMHALRGCSAIAGCRPGYNRIDQHGWLLHPITASPPSPPYPPLLPLGGSQTSVTSTALAHPPPTPSPPLGLMPLVHLGKALLSEAPMLRGHFCCWLALHQSTSLTARARTT